jgi:hypothetical protein
MDIQADVPSVYIPCLLPKNNAELLEKSSSKFRSLVKQIETRNFTGKQSDHQRHLKYAMKMAAKMINKHGNCYLVN